MTAALDDARPEPAGHAAGPARVPTPGGERAEPPVTEAYGSCETRGATTPDPGATEVDLRQSEPHTTAPAATPAAAGTAAAPGTPPGPAAPGTPAGPAPV